MKIPFNIKFRPQIESGEYKVETRDGRPVRIVCWDRKSAGGGQPIGALVENEHYEDSIWVKENGVYKCTMGHEYDLFIITPEEEMSEFEKAVYDCAWGKVTNKTECESKEEYAKRYATELLAIAKKELLKDAVEGYVRNGYPFSLHPYVDIEESKDKWCDIMHKNFMDGDKVRMVVLKGRG